MPKPGARFCAGCGAAVDHAAPPPAPDRRADGRGGPPTQALIAVIVVLALSVAALAVVVLTSSGDDDPDPVASAETDDDPDDGGSDEGGNTPTEASDAPDVDPSEIVVIVANGSGVSGAAGAVTDTLATLGYTPLEPTNTTVDTSETPLDTVYYVVDPDTQAQAERVAADLGLTTAAVAPIPADSPPAEIGLSQVLVVLGSSPGGLAETTIPSFELPEFCSPSC